MVTKNTLFYILAVLFLTACSEDNTNTSSMEVLVDETQMGVVDEALAENGKTTFEAKCTSCHKLDTKVIGPALQDVTKRRSANWIMNMIMNPEDMLANDADAKKLLKEYNNIPMTPLGITKDEARAILEYFRRSDS